MCGENHRASMGPRLFRRGNVIKNSLSYLQSQLQWGHVFSDVETLIRTARQIDWYKASMGPRLFRRGNECFICYRFRSVSRFNGATSFQTWKRKGGNPKRRQEQGFNGATSFQTWKPAKGSRPVREVDASMGPRLFRRGNQMCLPTTYRQNEASMGPRLFRRGNFYKFRPLR